MIAIREFGPRLRKFSVRLHCNGSRDRACLDDGDLMGIADACPALESFEVLGIYPANRRWPVLNSNSLVHDIMPICQNLKCLKLSGLETGSLQEISQIPHNLTTFELDHVFENGGHQVVGTGGQGDAFFQIIQQQIAANKARA